jgi:aquaporin Z
MTTNVESTVSTKTKLSLNGWTQVFLDHWPEYAMEGTGLGLFMISACIFGTLFGHADSPVVRFVGVPVFLRVLMGIAMGTTSVALVYSKFGKRSGAHLNPATTLTFLRLGRIRSTDATFYLAAQLIGGVGGVSLAGTVLGAWLAHPSVDYVVTLPGRYGYLWAFFAEVVMTFLLMSVILRVTNTPKLNRFTGIFAGLLVMAYISIEAPVSGMSMNPARSLASAFAAKNWTAIWVYFTAPPLGMLFAAELYRHRKGRVLCAKLYHGNQERCIFNCDYPARQIE